MLIVTIVSDFLDEAKIHTKSIQRQAYLNIAVRDCSTSLFETINLGIRITIFSSPLTVVSTNYMTQISEY